MEIALIPSSAKVLNSINYTKNTLIILGQDFFSTKTNYFFSNKEIKNLLSKTKNIAILINRYFFESELKKLEKYLLFLKNIGIKKILFTDFGVVEICHQKKIKFELIFFHETLVTNYGQFDFYKKNNISTVFLSPELNLKEINEIQEKKKNMKLMIQCAGYSFMFESKWKIISNYNKEYKKNIPINKKLFLKEESRNFPNYIFESKFGTYIYSSYNICLLKKIKELKNIDYLLIDSFMHDDTWTKYTFHIFHEAIKNCNSKTKLNNLFNEYKKINNKELNSEGFLGNVSDLPYLKNNDQK